MKKTQKITRVQLNINQQDDYILLGIVSVEPDYKLSLLLNTKFGISLRNISPVKIIDEKRNELAFSRFSDLSGSPHMIFTLISNRFGKNFFLKKLNNVDYVLHIQDPDNESNINHIIARLREIDTVTAVFKIDLKIIKDKNFQYLIL